MKIRTANNSNDLTDMLFTAPEAGVLRPSNPSESQSQKITGSMSFVYGWVAFCILQTLLVRLGTQSGYGLTAFWDELGFAALSLAFFSCLRLWAPQFIGQVVFGLYTTCLIVLAGANQLYYDAFHSWAGLYSVRQAGELGDIQTSISSMLPYDVILLWLCVPFGLLYGLVRSWKTWEPRLSTPLLALGILTLSIGHLNRVNTTSPTENHFLLRAIRLESKRVLQRIAPYNPTKVLGGTAISDVFAPMEGYTRPGSGNHPLTQYPFATQNPQHTPNIIIIEAESFRSAESGAYGARHSLTPEFDKLAKQGLRSHRFYASGMQTVRGELAIHCSTYPALGDLPIYKRVPKSDLTCLPQILKAANYENHWFSAYKASYSGKRKFLENHGFDHIHGAKEHGQPDDVHVGWGISDVIMADRIVDQLDRSEKPFLATWITLSNHHPWYWDYPLEFPEDLQVDSTSEAYDHYRRGIYYTDHAIGYFVSQVRKRDWGKDAWIVIVGDHGMAIFPENSKRSDFGKLEAHFRVPLLILAPDILKPGVFERTASQVDIAPTLLDMMGIKVPNAFVGQSILRSPQAKASPALLVGANAASLVLDDTRCFASTVTCKKNETPRCAENQNPSAATHVCFSQHSDLLFEEDNNLKTLPENRTQKLIKYLTLLPTMQTHLESSNRLGAGANWESSLAEIMATQTENRKPTSKAHKPKTANRFP
ncbi:MAG: LTA synthase family protein [Myxococcota bacterium]|nr:LTA synthase family protein [Myxococcota bacterium]